MFKTILIGNLVQEGVQDVVTLIRKVKSLNVSLLFKKIEPASGSRGEGIGGCMSRGHRVPAPPLNT